MIGKVISEKRKALGLTQAQLGERLGVTAPAVNRWEKGLSFPDVTLLPPLARCLHTDLNELFSFYTALSDKERELIMEKFNVTFFSEGYEPAIEYIEGVMKENPSDGLLFYSVALVLSASGTFTNESTYLHKVIEYYKRALELLPERSELINFRLLDIYSKIGDAEKAAYAWECLQEEYDVDKRWGHAEMLSNLKQYEQAVAEKEEYILRSIMDLIDNLESLNKDLSEQGNTELADMATEKANELETLFGIWSSRKEIEKLFLSLDPKNDNNILSSFENYLAENIAGVKLSSCPLFENVKLGGRPLENFSLSDSTADILNLLQTFPQMLRNRNN